MKLVCVSKLFESLFVGKAFGVPLYIIVEGVEDLLDNRERICCDRIVEPSTLLFGFDQSCFTKFGQPEIDGVPVKQKNFLKFANSNWSLN